VEGRRCKTKVSPMTCEPRESLIPTFDTLRRTHRPRLLLRTARLGLADYVRERDLRRILRLPAPPPPGPQSMAALLALEAAQERLRTRVPSEAGEPWRAARHVEVLIALLAEARLVFDPVPADPSALPRLVLRPVTAAPA
jgi:hypothetical protein